MEDPSPRASSATRPGPWPWVARKTAVGSCVRLRRVRKAGSSNFSSAHVHRAQGGAGWAICTECARDALRVLAFPGLTQVAGPNVCAWSLRRRRRASGFANHWSPACLSHAISMGLWTRAVGRWTLPRSLALSPSLQRCTSRPWAITRPRAESASECGGGLVTWLGVTLTADGVETARRRGILQGF